MVVMLGARIDVIQPQIRKVIAYLMPLPDKKQTTAVVKRAYWTETIVKNARVCRARLSEKVQ